MNGVASMTGANGRHADARLESTRHWLAQIVATLPEPRQRMYELFVARGLDSLSAALELGTGVAEVRRLRRENREAVLRAFEVTALAAEAAPGEPRSEAPGCGELRQIMATARDDDPYEGGRRRFFVLPAALRVMVVRHLSQCATCQDRGEDCMAAWAPQLLAIMGDAEQHEQVMADTQSMPEPGHRGPAPGAHRQAGPARKVVVRRAAMAGAGLLIALPLLAFVWPGFLDGQRSSAASSPQAFANSQPSSMAAPQAASMTGVAGSNHGKPVPHAASGILSGLSPRATGSAAAQLYASLPPSVYYTVPPSPSPTPSLVRPTPEASPTSAPTSASPSPSASAQKSKKPSPKPSPVTSTTPTSPATATTSPTPSAAPSTPASATPSSPAPSSPDPTVSASDPAAAAASPSPTATPSVSATS